MAVLAYFDRAVEKWTARPYCGGRGVHGVDQQMGQGRAEASAVTTRPVAARRVVSHLETPQKPKCSSRWPRLARRSPQPCKLGAHPLRIAATEPADTRQLQGPRSGPWCYRSTTFGCSRSNVGRRRSRSQTSRSPGTGFRTRRTARAQDVVTIRHGMMASSSTNRLAQTRWNPSAMMRT